MTNDGKEDEVDQQPGITLSRLRVYEIESTEKNAVGHYLHHLIASPPTVIVNAGV